MGTGVIQRRNLSPTTLKHYIRDMLCGIPEDNVRLITGGNNINCIRFAKVIFANNAKALVSVHVFISNFQGRDTRIHLRPLKY